MSKTLGRTGMRARWMQAEALDFFAGVFILGGLIFLPLLYGLLWLHLGYLEALPWSILSCFVFLIAFGPDVEFSWRRTIPAIAAGAVLVWLYHFGTGRPAYLAGGFAGYVVLAVCGYATRFLLPWLAGVRLTFRTLALVLLLQVAALEGYFLNSYNPVGASAGHVAALVNSHGVTYAELEKNYASQFQASAEGSSQDQVQIQKLELLKSMIDNEIMLQRAERLGLMASDADVEAKFNELKSPYTKEEFERQLRNRKMTVDDLKAQLRRDLSIQKLINREITSHITITDADVANFYNANKPSFNLAEPQVHMAQILVTPTPDPNVRNLKNSKAQNDTEAKQKILDIEGRLKTGEDFAMIAQNYSEDPNSAPNGGDLGFVPESALEKANVELRKMVMSLQPGGISPIIHTQEGYRILKVISKEPAGQRELNDPRVQQSIRETLLNRKDQLLKQAYYEVARNETKVVNYLARDIIGDAGASTK